MDEFGLFISTAYGDSQCYLDSRESRNLNSSHYETSTAELLEKDNQLWKLFV